MLYFALRDGATPEDILAAASTYLEEAVGLGSIPAGEQVQRVAEFLRTFRLVREKKAAWLIFWNSVLPAGVEAHREVVTIMDSRKSVDRIREFVEQTYMATQYTLREKMLYATRPKHNPYPATVHADFRARLTAVTCGHNPWLEARFVRGLRLERAPDGHEILTWS
jgi:hypothetical protein